MRGPLNVKLLLSFAHNLSSATSPHEREHAVKLTGLLQMYANFQSGIHLYISTKLIPSSCIFRQFWKGLSIYYIHPTYRCGINHTVDVTLSGIEFCLCSMKYVTHY
jgi:hypothetical protein